MATTQDSQYVKFNAYAIKDLILRKLAEDSTFTDQVFEGSNLNILIDLVSYMYQCLMFNLNTAASESMFADSQVYENISRLCKFIGYNPKGVETATASFMFDNRYEDGKYLMRFLDDRSVDEPVLNEFDILTSDVKSSLTSNYESVEIPDHRSDGLSFAGWSPTSAALALSSETVSGNIEVSATYGDLDQVDIKFFATSAMAQAGLLTQTTVYRTADLSTAVDQTDWTEDDVLSTYAATTIWQTGTDENGNITSVDLESDSIVDDTINAYPLIYKFKICVCSAATGAGSTISGTFNYGDDLTPYLSSNNTSAVATNNEWVVRNGDGTVYNIDFSSLSYNHNILSGTGTTYLSIYPYS